MARKHHIGSGVRHQSYAHANVLRTRLVTALCASVQRFQYVWIFFRNNSAAMRRACAINNTTRQTHSPALTPTTHSTHGHRQVRPHKHACMGLRRWPPRTSGNADAVVT